MTYHDLIGTKYLQDLNHDYLFADVAAFNQRLMGPAHVENVANLACRSALANRSVSHICLPIDFQVQEMDDGDRFKRNVPGHTAGAEGFVQPRPVPPRAHLERAAELLRGKTKPAILAGAGARGAGAELEALAEKLGGVIVKALLGKDAVPDDSPYVTGGTGVVGTRPSQEAFAQCDALIIRRLLVPLHRVPAGTFAAAAERCFGVGACRDMEGVMCPSYQATFEEKHSTRGRARLLFEMMRSDVLQDGWRSEEVKELLDLCLACKGCKNECPVRVDMATYKAEFLAHYYKGRLRPRQAYALGLIMFWARLAARAPRLANALAGSRLGKRLAGIAPQRTPPRFAAEPFAVWFTRRRGPRPANGRRVILWPDTFTNYFEPEVAKAAVEVLEVAGCSIELPRGHLCCGRPLYDFGMLTLARRQLEQIIERLRPEIRAGVDVVGLEPSCVDVFRDELLNMLPHDEDAKRLSKQTFSFVEFLSERLEWEPPPLADRVVLQGHCHHRAAEKTMRHDRALLDRLGVDYEILDTGCCGMAGSFGYHAGEQYDVSVAVARHSLLPKLEQLPPTAVVVADGFSCRAQIEQLDGRRAVHTAQLVQRALRESGRTGPEKTA